MPGAMLCDDMLQAIDTVSNTSCLGLDDTSR
jgi:hypothetical protein